MHKEQETNHWELLGKLTALHSSSWICFMLFVENLYLEKKENFKILINLKLTDTHKVSSIKTNPMPICSSLCGEVLTLIIIK